MKNAIVPLIYHKLKFALTIACMFCFYAAFTQSFTGSANGSDYQVNFNYSFSWNNISLGACECNNETQICVRPFNNYNADCDGWQTATSGSLSFNAGPNQSIPYHLKVRVRGNILGVINTPFGPITDCLENQPCEGSEIFGPITVNTAPIKSPLNLQVEEYGLDFISLNWEKGTDIPNNNISYRIYRDSLSNLVDSVAGNILQWTDTTLSPTQTHTYYITTYTEEWGGHESAPIMITGSTFPVTFTASDCISYGSTQLEWSDLSSLNGLTSWAVFRDGNFLTDSDVSGGDGYLDLTGIPGRKYFYELYLKIGDDPYKSWPILTDIGGKRPNGTFRGKVVSRTGAPVPNVEVCATLQDNIEQSQAGTTYCDTTLANGTYEITDIYYDDDALFKLIPFKGSHTFDPIFQEHDLNINQFQKDNINFVDTTILSVSGYVYQEFDWDDCPKAGVLITVKDANFPTFEQTTETDEDGYYSVAVEGPGAYLITPEFGNHEFSPESYTLSIQDNTNNVDFKNIQTNVLSGHLRGSCETFIGQAQIRIYSLGEPNFPCVEQIVETQIGTGYFEVELPAANYELEVIGFEHAEGIPITPDNLISYFEIDTIDLNFEAQSRDYVYREAPVIQITYPPLDIECDNYEYTILEQGVSYPIEIEVLEGFGDELCHINEGYVIFGGDVEETTNTPDTIILEAGRAIKMLTPGFPNTIFPHLKLLEITAIVGNEISTFSEEVLVVGHFPREQTFTTVSPEIPYLILRDPPGDKSYSYFEESTRSESAFRIYQKEENSTDAWLRVQLGHAASISTGVVSTQNSFWGAAEGSVEIGTRTVSSDELVISFEHTEQFETEDEAPFIGEEGDVYLGFALNMIYALADVVVIDESNCQPIKYTDLIMGGEGIETSFRYTHHFIENSLLPDLKLLRDLSSLQGQLDSVDYYNNQISIWEQCLDRNRDLKNQAVTVDNISFDAGSPSVSETSTSILNSSTIECSMFFDTTIVGELGWNVAGSGMTTRVERKMLFDIGSSSTNTILEERKVGYRLDDNDPGDFFSVEVKYDYTYGTPVFAPPSGRSSCPWEEGTQPREGPQLTANTYAQYNIPSDGEAEFRLTLANLSQSNEGRLYYLDFLQESNPDGASIFIGGSPVGSEPENYTIAANEALEATVTVSRNGQAYTYDCLQFALTSGCGDEAIADTICLTTHFESPCSDVFLSYPQDNWLINEDAGNDLLFEFSDYNKDFINQIKLQFAPQGTSNWTTAMTLTNEDISENSTTDFWDLADIPDGYYQLRLRLDCGQGFLYSNIVNGVIDRKPPIAISQQPANGIYAADDIIAVDFDETIDCYNVDNSAILLSTPSGQFFNAQIGCQSNRIIIQPESALYVYDGLTINVELDPVADLNGNIMNELIQWSFITEVSSPPTEIDTDGDGILDENDNCPLAYDPEQADMDNDGIGDVCDPDIDGDGIDNSMDNCAFYANPEQSDLDGDNIGDECDPDLDGDGIFNWNDNCIDEPNSGQEDTNGDGIGDACQPINNIEDGQFEIFDFSLLPNPANNSVVIKWHFSSYQQASQLGLYNTQGQLLRHFSYPTSSIQEIDVSNLSNGVYIVKLQLTDKQLVKKLIIQH